MPHAINLRSDDPSARQIVELWDRCSRLEQVPSMRSLHYPPHITLGIYDDADPAHLIELVQTLTTPSVALEFARVRHFDGPRGMVLWAEPTRSAALCAIHEHLHALIHPSLCRANYRPGNWVPHCTLAMSIDESSRDDALAICNAPIEGFEVVFDVLDCARFYPVHVLGDKALARD